MPKVCNVDDRIGLYWLKREGRVNSRVQLIPENGDLSPISELVATSSLRDVRSVTELPRQDRTAFREWFRQMTSGWGSRPEWPQLLCNLIHSRYLAEREIDRRYVGQRLVTDRGTTPVGPEPWDEKTSVRNLFNTCYESANGCLTIGDELFWLLGYEVTNMHDYQGQRADLLALSQEGGLVVFEAKLAKNSYAPVCALLEGMDYLTGLTCRSNFDRLLVEIAGFPRPKPFENVTPDIEGRHAVVVIAEADYFRVTFERSPRGRGWKELARIRPEDGEHVQLRFANSDFKKTTAEWELGE